GRSVDVRLLREVLGIRRRAQGKAHPACAKTLEALGSELLRQRKSDEAVPLLEEALAIRQKQFGADDLGCVNLLTYLAGHYSRTRQFAKAEPYLRQQGATARKRLDREQEVFEGRWTMTLGTPPELASHPMAGYNAAAKRLSCAFALGQLARLHADMGEHARA